MWADELEFGAFIVIWPITLMINAAVSFLLSLSSCCMCLSHQNSGGCYEIPKQPRQ